MQTLWTDSETDRQISETESKANCLIMSRCDNGLVSDLRCVNDADCGLYPVKVESELPSRTSTVMVTVVAAVMMLLLIVLPESRVRSVMA